VSGQWKVVKRKWKVESERAAGAAGISNALGEAKPLSTFHFRFTTFH
jgi:hypothetical protein